MSTRTYQLTLEGLPVPSGEIDVRDLVAILEPIRLTALRVAPGRGKRSDRPYRQLTRCRRRTSFQGHQAGLDRVGVHPR